MNAFRAHARDGIWWTCEMRKSTVLLSTDSETLSYGHLGNTVTALLYGHFCLAAQQNGYTFSCKKKKRKQKQNLVNTVPLSFFFCNQMCYKNLKDLSWNIATLFRLMNVISLMIKICMKMPCGPLALKCKTNTKTIKSMWTNIRLLLSE